MGNLGVFFLRTTESSKEKKETALDTKVKASDKSLPKGEGEHLGSLPYFNLHLKTKCQSRHSPDNPEACVSGLQNPRGRDLLQCFKRPDPILVPNEPLLVESTVGGVVMVGRCYRYAAW